MNTELLLLIAIAGPVVLSLLFIALLWRKQVRTNDHLLRMQTFLEGQNQQIERFSQSFIEKANSNAETISKLSHEIKLQTAEGREIIARKLASNNQEQQTAIYRTQQELAEKFAKLQQSLEQRFGEVITNQTKQAGQLSETLLGRFEALQTSQTAAINENRLQMTKNLTEFKEQLQTSANQQQTRFDEHQLNSLKLLQESMQKAMQDMRIQITESLTNNANTVGKQVEKLTQDTDRRLKEISGQVERRLSEGFEKTTATFADVIKRLALIDEAQKKITELSSNVVSLQHILADKRSRGAFGEVQLSGLIRNVLPESAFDFQYTLSNGRRPDCYLYLPEPTGNVAIDAKFPLESYQRFVSVDVSDSERRQAEQQFRQDIRKHINDIADKYIIEGETSDGAVMFIPAEAIFAEIHANYPELVEHAQKSKVWMVSPTTMMAILTTVRAVLKDEATRRQVHIIQEHLVLLSKDFNRFQQRMDNLARHIGQAHQDVEQVQVSAVKISRRFNRIEKVELDSDETEEENILEKL